MDLGSTQLFHQWSLDNVPCAGLLEFPSSWPLSQLTDSFLTTHVWKLILIIFGHLTTIPLFGTYQDLSGQVMLNLAGSLFQCSLKKLLEVFLAVALFWWYTTQIRVHQDFNWLFIITYCPFPEKPCFTCASSSSNLMCNRLAIDRPCPEDKQLCRLVKRVSIGCQ